jgi:hypothetical protein
VPEDIEDNNLEVHQKTDEIFKRIERECKEEEERDTLILQQKIEEATKEIFSGYGDTVEASDKFEKELPS